MNNNKLSDYITYIDSMTTKEFCDEHSLPLPRFTGDTKTSATAFLQIDAIKYRLINEFNKSLMENDNRS